MPAHLAVFNLQARGWGQIRFTVLTDLSTMQKTARLRLRSTPQQYSDTVQLLLHHDASMVNTVTIGPENRTPLTPAIQYGQTALVVTLLLSQGANLDQPDAAGRRALYHACAAGGSLNLATLLVHRGADLNSPDKYGDTTVTMAASKVNLSTLAFLLKNRAIVDPVGKDGMTPLMHACDRGHKNVARLLLAIGADPNEPDSFGRTALHFAAMLSPFSIRSLLVPILLQHGATFAGFSGGRYLREAVASHDLDAVVSYIDNGLAMDEDAHSGGPFLHLAIAMDSIPMVLLLLEKGTDTIKVDHNGQTALQLAEQSFRREIADALQQWESQGRVCGRFHRGHRGPSGRTHDSELATTRNQVVSNIHRAP